MLDIKTKLIERIRKSENDDLLKELFLILESADNDGVVQLNSSQIELIKKSEDAVNDGDFFTDKEIEGDLDEGLKE